MLKILPIQTAKRIIRSAYAGDTAHMPAYLNILEKNETTYSNSTAK